MLHKCVVECSVVAPLGYQRLRRISQTGPDDGAQFHVDGVEAIGGAPEVVLATAFSYPIQDDDLATTFDLPRIEVRRCFFFLAVVYSTRHLPHAGD